MMSLTNAEPFWFDSLWPERIRGASEKAIYRFLNTFLAGLSLRLNGGPRFSRG
jgi:hypothetical protein